MPSTCLNGMDHHTNRFLRMICSYHSPGRVRTLSPIQIRLERGQIGKANSRWYSAPPNNIVDHLKPQDNNFSEETLRPLVLDAENFCSTMNVHGLTSEVIDQVEVTTPRVHSTVSAPLPNLPIDQLHENRASKAHCECIA